MGTRTRIVLGVVIIGAVLLAAAMFLQRGDSQAQARLIAETPDTTGFARVEGPPEFDFPEAHGPHPDYQTEWWYYTGNLDTADGRHFGYQLTFFRRALRPPAETADRASGWAADQVYMAHFALTDGRCRARAPRVRALLARGGGAGRCGVPAVCGLAGGLARRADRR